MLLPRIFKYAEHDFGHSAQELLAYYAWYACKNSHVKEPLTLKRDLLTYAR